MFLDDLIENAENDLAHGDYESAAEYVRAYDEAVAAGIRTCAALEAEANYITRRIAEMRPDLAIIAARPPAA